MGPASASTVERLGDVVVDQHEVGSTAEVRDVERAAGDEVVETHDLVTAFEQRITQVRSEEAGAAGNDDAHQRRPTPS